MRPGHVELSATRLLLMGDTNPLDCLPGDGNEGIGRIIKVAKINCGSKID